MCPDRVVRGGDRGTMETDLLFISSGSRLCCCQGASLGYRWHDCVSGFGGNFEGPRECYVDGLDMMSLLVGGWWNGGMVKRSRDDRDVHRRMIRSRK
jgi:hypothetical protein